MLRALVAACLVLAMSACAPREPSDTDLLRALQRHHQDWAVAQRPPAASDRASFVNLPFEAALTLHIRAVQKERCWRAEEESGYFCTVRVKAATAYASHLERRIEARFVEGTRGWIALSPRSIDGALAGPANAVGR